MMGSAFVAFIAAIGATAWIYTKMSNRTGGQAGPALTVSGIAGLFVFVILLLVLNAVLPG